MDINSLTIIGRLTGDPEYKTTGSGTSVCNFSIANSEKWTSDGEKQERTSFFNCIAWGKIGEIISQYCKKGNRIAIQGRIQQQTWDGEDGKKRSTVKIVVQNFQFLTQKNSDSAQVESQPVSDDDIPF